MPEYQVQYDEELAERQVLDVHLSAQAQARVHHSLYHQLTEHRKDNMVELIVGELIRHRKTEKLEIGLVADLDPVLF